VLGRAAKPNLLATAVDAFHRSGFAILTMTVWTEATKKTVGGPGRSGVCSEFDVACFTKQKLLHVFYVCGNP